MENRVVITGSGLVSSIGNGCNEVLKSLQQAKSGIEFVQKWKDCGFDSHVAGTLKLPSAEELRADFGGKGRFMGESALHSLLCAEEAVQMSGLSPEELKSPKMACIVGSSFSNSDSYAQVANRNAGRENDVGPFEVTRSLTNSIPANFSSYYGMRGRSYSIGSACATSAHNIGHAYELIKHGECDAAMAGGADEVTPLITGMFAGMGRVLSKQFNDHPETASRPYDKGRDGFVISGGAGIVILENYERASARGANILGELVGFGASADGYDIIKPHPAGEGCYRSMEMAFSDSGLSPRDIDYVNTHGTSTPKGDLVEVSSVSRIFGNKKVPISSTKSLTGHGLGAAGVHELIYGLLMMREGFIAGSANIENLDPAFDDVNIVQANQACSINAFLSNSFGFGGTNCSLIVSRCD